LLLVRNPKEFRMIAKYPLPTRSALWIDLYSITPIVETDFVKSISTEKLDRRKNIGESVCTAQIGPVTHGGSKAGLFEPRLAICVCEANLPADKILTTDRLLDDRPVQVRTR
jgi:hypothetical protein